MMHKRRIRKVAILGSGVMGSQIAAHCINAGLEVLLLDLKSDDPKRPNRIVEDSLKKISKMKPAPFSLSELSGLIQIGNFEDDLARIGDCDWVCEVVIERLDIKKSIMAKIDALRGEHTIITSNTSGLPISSIAEDCSDEMKAHFLGSHFFNPPRYMQLLELIPIIETDEEVLASMNHFFESVLGKGVVACKDTPNFIANRIGVYSIASLLPYFFGGDFRAEDIDVLCGTLTGYSKAASFRTADLAGLDVLLHVAKNLYPAIPDDEQRDVFNVPENFAKMVEQGKIGNKAGQGFFKKVQTKQGREFHVINPETLEYELQQPTPSEVVADAKKIGSPIKRLKFLANHDSKEGRFIWEVQRNLMCYSANRVPEISDSIEAIDRAMKWGFNWQLGPFERWDALGVQEVANRLKEEGASVPVLIEELLGAGFSSFYEGDKVYDPATKTMITQSPKAHGELTVDSLLAENEPILENPSAALLDMGDGVALFQFRTKRATLNSELVNTLYESLKIVEKDFKALVISHDGEHFAYGADLMEAITAHQTEGTAKVKEIVEDFQRTAVALRYAPFPVVAAPFGMTLGGGAEFVLYSDRVIAHHELYMGLVEVGVGLIPAGGGTTELLKRAMSDLPGDADPLPFVKEAFKTIGLAKVSESAPMAKKMGLLKESDIVVMNRNQQLSVAKTEALAMAEAGYSSPTKMPIEVLGKKALSTMKLMLYVMNEAGFATDYDKVVADRVAFVLAGGDLSESQQVPEDYLLKLEREAIFECLADERTHARIEHMLKKGKPLRN